MICGAASVVGDTSRFIKVSVYGWTGVKTPELVTCFHIMVAAAVAVTVTVIGYLLE
jgi:hypothetical protein